MKCQLADVGRPGPLNPGHFRQGADLRVLGGGAPDKTERQRRHISDRDQRDVLDHWAGDKTFQASIDARDAGSNGGFTCSGSTTQVVNSGVATFTGCSYSSASANPYTLTASSTGTGR